MGKFLKSQIQSVCKVGDYTLTSGVKSDFYINIKQLMFDPKCLFEMGYHMCNLIERTFRISNVRAVGGVELGSVPLSSAIALASQRHIVGSDIYHFAIRKNAKTHGTNAKIEGFNYIEGRDVVIVDDVLTSGKSINIALEALKPHCNVLGAIVVVDRQEDFKTELSIPVHSLFKRSELV